MLTPEQHLAGLDLTALEIERMTTAAFEELLRRVGDGEAPQAILADIEARWAGEFQAALSARLSERMAMSIGSVEVRDWPIGEVTLSDRLREQARDVSALVRRLVSAHAQGWHDARRLASDIYEGYGFKAAEPAAVSAGKSIPKYLRAAFGDDQAFADLWRHQYTGKTLRVILEDPLTGQPLAVQYARLKAMNIRTPALKAAYMQAIEGIEKGQGAARLKKQLEIAYYEKNRYFANRIAQTELHRVFTDQQAGDLMVQDRIEFVQWRLSGTHPVTDICDYHAKVDRYGLGPGVYPKHLAPKPPAHPHCRCMLSPRINIAPGTSYREDPEAGRAWLREQGTAEGAKVLGSRDKLAAVLGGKSLDEVVNAGVPGAYRVKRVGEVAGTVRGMNSAFAFMGQRPGLAGLTPVEITELSGEEFGAGLSRGELGKAADNMLRGLQHGDGLPNQDTGWALRINKDGRKKMGDNADLTPAENKAVAGLESLVKRAVVSERHPDDEHRNPDVNAVLRLYAPMTINGAMYRVKLTVKDYKGKDAKRQLHALAAVEIENAPPGIFPSYSNAGAFQTGQPTTGRTVSIADLLRGAMMNDGLPFDF